MKRIWKTLGVVVLVVILLGAVCVAVGMSAGADISRIYTVLDTQYGITEIVSFLSQYPSGLF